MEMDDKWGNLDPGVIDTIIKQLKRKDLRKEIQNLRLLNKHWHQAGVFHVTYATYHLTPSDFLSLSKFKNLTSVRLPDVLSHRNSSSEEWKIGPYLKRKRIQGMDSRDLRQIRMKTFESIIDVLCKLPKLYQIDIRTRAATGQYLPFVLKQLARIETLHSARLGVDPYLLEEWSDEAFDAMIRIRHSKNSVIPINSSRSFPTLKHLLMCLKNSFFRARTSLTV